MPLPPLLQDWDTTIRGLHLAAEVLGALRVVAQLHDPHWLELALKPVPVSLSTDRLPAGGELILDCSRAALVYRKPTAEHVIPLQGATQRTLLDSLLPLLAQADLPQLLQSPQQDSPSLSSEEAAEGEVLLSSMRAAIRAKGHTLLVDDTPPQHETIALNTQTARDYGDALYTVFTAIAHFRAHLKGHMTPIVVFPEHFDLSMLWFLDSDMNEHKAHLNFGFAPFSPGLPRPYLYAYAYPYPPNLTYPALPPPARWHYEGWTGVVVDYDVLREQDDAAITMLCEGIFGALRPLLG
jgi:hypothetical protein